MSDENTRPIAFGNLELNAEEPPAFPVSLHYVTESDKGSPFHGDGRSVQTFNSPNLALEIYNAVLNLPGRQLRHVRLSKPFPDLLAAARAEAVNVRSNLGLSDELFLRLCTADEKWMERLYFEITLIPSRGISIRHQFHTASLREARWAMADAQRNGIEVRIMVTKTSGLDGVLLFSNEDPKDDPKEKYLEDRVKSAAASDLTTRQAAAKELEDYRAHRRKIEAHARASGWIPSTEANGELLTAGTVALTTQVPTMTAPLSAPQVSAPAPSGGPTLAQKIAATSERLFGGKKPVSAGARPVSAGASNGGTTLAQKIAAAEIDVKGIIDKLGA